MRRTSPEPAFAAFDARYHGLFDDDMHVVTAPGTYDFSAIDSTWDFLLASGVRPIVELSFMPAFIANCSWHGHCKENPLGCEGYWCTQCNGNGVGPVVNPSAPARRLKRPAPHPCLLCGGVSHS